MLELAASIGGGGEARTIYPSSSANTESAPFKLFRRQFILSAAAVAVSSSAFFSPSISNLDVRASHIGPLDLLSEGIPDDHESFDVRDAYGLVKAAFGLSVTDTAKLFSVHRKTIYEWLSADSKPQPQKENIERARTLSALASVVVELRLSPVGRDAELILEGKSLWNFVDDQRIDREGLKAWLLLLVEHRKGALEEEDSLLHRMTRVKLPAEPESDVSDYLV